MSKNEDKLLEIPSQLETDRLILRSYRAGDGQFFFDMVENGNREHLKEILGYITETKDVSKIEIWIQGLAADWHAHNRFVLSFWEGTLVNSSVIFGWNQLIGKYIFLKWVGL